jgi:hypothetical protein
MENSMCKGLMSSLFAGLMLIPTIAFAQDNADATPPVGGDPGTVSEDTATAPPNNGDLPQPTSDDDAYPEVATPGIPEGGVVEQAGAGGSTGYGRAGVLELGGSAGFVAASDLTSVSFAPQLGWFVADNVQLSGIVDMAYSKVDEADATSVAFLVEPSYHLPINRTVFGFLGVGAGLAYIDGPGAAFALAPRLGGNFLIGRSGVLTPSVSYQYNTHGSDVMAEGQTLLLVSSAVRANIGYTIMW